MGVYICSKGLSTRPGRVKAEARSSVVLLDEPSVLVAGVLGIETALGLAVVVALGVTLGVVGLAVVSAVVGRLASRDDRVVGLTRRTSASTRARRRNEQDSRRLCDHFRWGGPTFGW
jgi:hypothetical protein